MPVESAGDSPPESYGGRFDEDAFDYPVPPASPTDEAPVAADFAGPSHEANEERRSRRGRSREPAGRPWGAARHVRALAAAAVLLVLGGFGFALSAVSDTVSSDPDPGGTAQVPAPRSPTAQPPPPGTAPPAEEPVAPAPSASAPASGADREHRQGEQEREDGDRSDG